MYASYNDYIVRGGVKLTEEQWQIYERRARIHIDAVTFNRIHERGFEDLSAYRQEMVKEAVCLQADFEFENEDIINSVVSSYGINGVSVSLGNAPASVEVMGLLMSRDAHGALSNAGLTTLSFKW